MNKHYIFVYGTLKRNRGNHRLLASSKFIGEAVTKEPYGLVASGIPFMVESDDIPNYNVKGELYEVESKDLGSLDSLEGHPNVYCRKPVTVILADNTEVNSEAYIYTDPERVISYCKVLKGEF